MENPRHMIYWLLLAVFVFLPTYSHAENLAAEAYADYNGLTPAKPKGEAFALSHDYPKSLPPRSDDKWNSSIKNWPVSSSDVNQYLLALREYVYNDLQPVDFRPTEIETEGNSGGWYNAPWLSQRYTEEEMNNGIPTWMGRDYYRGLYFGTPLPPGQLGPTQTETYENWEIVFYNDIGGYFLGQLWGKDGHLARPLETESFQFPEGTVITKLVFTTAPRKYAMSGAVSWKAYLPVNPAACAQKPMSECEGKLKSVQLTQIDIIVKDSVRAPESTWVFASYAYDKNAKGKDGWDRMVPLGVMWGNDIEVAPGYPLAETVINPDPSIPAFFRNDLGFGHRMVGPIDAARGTGTCLGCHSASEFSLTSHQLESPARMTIPPGSNPTEAKKYYRNLAPTEAWSCENTTPRDCEWIALDYSYVMLGALSHYYTKLGKKVPPNALVDRPRRITLNR